MKTRLKKSTYVFGLLFLCVLAVLCHHLFSTPETVSADHIALPLSPFTQREQKDLIRAQEQEDQLDVAGPLVAQMSASDAQSRVLNLNRPSQRLKPQK